MGTAKRVPVWGRMNMATAEIPIIRRRTFKRPSASDIQPEKIRPEALPAAAMTRLMAASAAAATPTLFANGTSWLMTIRPAEAPSAYATHMNQNVGVRSASPGWNSYVVAAALAAGAGDQPGGRYPAGGFFSRKD